MIFYIKQHNLNSIIYSQQANLKQLNNEFYQKVEREILKVIDKCQELLSTFSTKANKNMEIILLVGTTGAGKSTLFNFLSGADFKIQDRELQLRNPSNKFSEMKGGMNSVTKEPKYFYNSEFNHLLIGFPRFQDTDAELEQLLMELLFQKVVTLMPIKVVYVIKNNESTLPNRGVQIIKFLDQLFKNSNLNVNKFNLLLNCFLENLSDDELRRNIRRELTQANKSNFIDNILVIRKVLNAENLYNYFKAEKRYELWQQLQQISSILLKPKSIPKSDIISQYLRQSIQKITDEYDGIIKNNVNQCCNQLNNPKHVEQLKQTQSIIDNIIKQKCQDNTQWYTTFLQNCQKIPGDHQKEKNFSNFQKILQYCSQLSNQIEKYSDNLNVIRNTLKKLEEKLYNKQEKIKLEQNITELQTQGEQVKQKLNQQIANNQNLEQRMNRINQDNSYLRVQIEIQKEQNSRLVRQFDRQLEQNEKLQKQMEEQKKQNSEMLWAKLEQVQQQREQNIRNQTQIEKLQKDLQEQKEKAEKKIKQMEERMKCFRKKPIRRRR